MLDSTWERLRRRDPTVMDDLYATYAGLIHRYAFTALRDHRTAEDILQQVMWKVWQHPPREDGNFNGWVAQLTRNVIIDYQRQHIAEPAELIEVEVAPDYDTAIDLKDALGKLSMRDQNLMDKVLAGYTKEEIAMEWEVPVGTVKTWFHRGLVQMRANLEGRMGLKERAKELAEQVWKPNLSQRAVEKIAEGHLRQQDGAARREEHGFMHDLLEGELSSSPWASVGFDRVIKKLEERTRGLDG